MWNVGIRDGDVKENGTRGLNPKAKIPKRLTEADQLVVLLKPGNAGGGKGLTDSAKE